MKRALAEVIKQQLSDKSSEKFVRGTFLLRGVEAAALDQLHREVGGPDRISRNELASRILSRALTQKSVGPRGNKASEERIE
ncbi:hypothetical protein [Candidatus Nitrospira nitrificans]|nr:hypothetical protein [Candidatus Nitrospira nitrificans]